MKAQVETIQCTPSADYWASVTNVSCPCGRGVLCWAEAGYVPGWRECDACGRQYQAAGDKAAPVLELRRGPTRRRGEVMRRAEAAAEANRRNSEGVKIWGILYAIENSLPVTSDGKVYGPGDSVHGVSGDDLPAVRHAVEEVQRMTGTVNLRPAGEPGDIADRIATQRRLCWPEAWAAWERLRSLIPKRITIRVSADGTKAELIGIWSPTWYCREIARLKDEGARDA